MPAYMQKFNSFSDFTISNKLIVTVMYFLLFCIYCQVMNINTNKFSCSHVKNMLPIHLLRTHVKVKMKAIEKMKKYKDVVVTYWRDYAIHQEYKKLKIIPLCRLHFYFSARRHDIKRTSFCSYLLYKPFPGF